MSQHNENLRNHLEVDPEALDRLARFIWGTQYHVGNETSAYWLDHDILVFHGCDSLYLVCWQSQSLSDAHVAARMLVALGQAYRKIVGTDCVYRTHLIRLPTPHLAYLYRGGCANPAVRTITLYEALAMPTPCCIELRIHAINLDSSSSSEQFPWPKDFATP